MVAGLSPVDQVRFAKACLDHVVAAAGHAEPLPDELRRTVVDPVSQFAGEVIQLADASRLAPPDANAALDVLWPSLEAEMRVDAQHVGTAAAQLAEIAGGGTAKDLDRLLNHLDEFVDTVDPEGERGIAEEAEWRTRLLDEILAHPEGDMTVLEPLVDERLDWSRRYEADWRR